jgi:hypothetical protein
MKYIYSTSILILLSHLLFAQNPLVKQWDYRFGGSSLDQLEAFKQTADGGFILTGWSKSDSSGDKSEPTWSPGNWDFWIVKTNAGGNKQWDRTFGGSAEDYLNAVQQTTDGGFVFAGYSNSPISGNKTHACWGIYDYWMVKTDDSGNLLWDKTYGGYGSDQLTGILQTADGGYLLGGYSNSGISGDKTEDTRNPGLFIYDYWIIKTDSLGNKLWDKDFGGEYHDQLDGLDATSDGGYILAGSSQSVISGDKTEDSWGMDDYWIVKIDSLGNKQWDKDFGGTGNDVLSSVQQTDDGGYILGGEATSGADGVKTQPTWGGYDYWMVKTDSLGNTLWDKDFGGIYFDMVWGLTFQTSDKGYLIAGASESGISGDKTEDNWGGRNSWLVKTDSAGNKQWDKTIFSFGTDDSGFAMELDNGCYLTGTSSGAQIGGYKTQPPQGGLDYWIVKFCDSTFSTSANAPVENSINCLVFPNPFSSEISFSISNATVKQVSFSIKNLLGQTLFMKQENNISSRYTKTVDLGFLSKGIYFLEVLIDDHLTFKKIVKR